MQTQVVEREDKFEKFAALVTRDRNLVPQLGILGVDVDADIAKLLPLPRKLGGVVVAALAVDSRYWPTVFFPET